MLSVQNDPPFDAWNKYIKPHLIEARLQNVFIDIIKKGEKTRFSKIYDSIYELIEADVEYEHFHRGD